MNDYISKTGDLSKPDLLKETQKKNSPVQKGDNSFGRILSERLKNPLSAEDPKQASALSEIQSPLKTPLAEAFFDPKKYAEKLGGSLDLLETYAAFLEDPDKTLKQASELLDQLLNQIQGLEQELKTTDSHESDLNQILTQISTTANLERIKIDRGDYLI